MSKSIILTGGFGFIGSSLCEYLNRQGISPYIIEDQENVGEKWKNIMGLRFALLDSIYDINKVDGPISVIHLGANVDTREKMNRQLWQNNLTFTTDLFKVVQEYQVLDKFIYASSGAVYGGEENEFSERIEGLKPTNAYAATKLLVDNHFFGAGKKWESPHVYGLRFFNVYGPREQAKGDMASLVYKGLTKQKPLYAEGEWRLFKSYRPDIKDGFQMRDFVAAMDVCKVIYFFLNGNNVESGIYNVGSGISTPFKDLITEIDQSIPIEYIDIPDNIRSHYQYYTRADISKLRKAGYNETFMDIKEGIKWTKENL